jgi:hypothetical protein
MSMFCMCIKGHSDINTIVVKQARLLACCCSLHVCTYMCVHVSRVLVVCVCVVEALAEMVDSMVDPLFGSAQRSPLHLSVRSRAPACEHAICVAFIL